VCVATAAGTKNYAQRQSMIVGMLLFGGAAVAKVAQDSAGAQLLLGNVVGLSCRAPAALLLGHKCVFFLVAATFYILVG
jgi:hypothetical protein